MAAIWLHDTGCLTQLGVFDHAGPEGVVIAHEISVLPARGQYGGNGAKPG
jgi:hypothetical protein